MTVLCAKPDIHTSPLRIIKAKVRRQIPDTYFPIQVSSCQNKYLSAEMRFCICLPGTDAKVERCRLC